jgi:hypothetical protein
MVGEFALGERALRVAKAAGDPKGERVYARIGATEAVVLVVGSDPVTLQWASGWKEVRRASVPGALVAVAARDDR